MRLDLSVYKLSALELAPKLLGMKLCRNYNGNVKKMIITETEAYYGEHDTACHASKGKTKRTEIMYNQGGFAYIYLCYGIHNLLNIVSGEKDFPEAVLIRGGVLEDKNNMDIKEIFTNKKSKLNLSGPGKLTKALDIDRTLNGENLVISNDLWIEDSKKQYKYTQSKRIGINYATEEYINKLWRYNISI